MKASELIRKLAYEIQMYGDLEISFELLDKNLNKQEICGSPDISIYHNFDKTCLSIWQHYE